MNQYVKNLFLHLYFITTAIKYIQLIKKNFQLKSKEIMILLTLLLISRVKCY